MRSAGVNEAISIFFVAAPIVAPSTASCFAARLYKERPSSPLYQAFRFSFFLSRANSLYFCIFIQYTSRCDFPIVVSYLHLLSFPPHSFDTKQSSWRGILIPNPNFPPRQRNYTYPQYSHLHLRSRDAKRSPLSQKPRLLPPQSSLYPHNSIRTHQCTHK